MSGAMSWTHALAVSLDEFRGNLGDDRVAESAQLAHAAGNPMSQRECSGLNAPAFVVSAVDDVEGIPEARRACASRPTWTFLPLWYAVPPFILACAIERPPFGTFGVAHAANCATSPRYSGTVFWLAFRLRKAAHFAIVSSSRTRSTAVGVGHEPKAPADVRRSDACSAQIAGPEGISHVFQVSPYSGEPFTSILARNLLSKHSCRLALGDECVKSGPEVSFVGMALPLSRARKRLTGTGAGPHGSVVGPICEPEGVGPACNAGEEMALDVAAQIVGSDIDDGTLVNVAWRDESCSDEVAEPLRGEGVNLVVVRSHTYRLPVAKGDRGHAGPHTAFETLPAEVRLTTPSSARCNRS
jgi:hypothetical protein